MKQLKYPAMLLCCTLLQACTEESSNLQNSPANPATVVEKKHGVGKQVLDCDMTQLVIEHGVTTQSLNVNELLNKTGADVGFADDRRWQETPAISLAELITATTAPHQLLLFGCGDTAGLSLDATEIQKAPKHYLLMKNNADRLRLALFDEQRRRYRTLVKNLTHIKSSH